MSARDLPEVRQARGSPEPMPGRCGGKLRLTDPPRYCIKYPLASRTRCELHNGRAAWGHDASNVKAAINSRYGYLSPRVFADFQRAMQDEQLMDLRPDVALLEVLKQRAAEGMAAGESLVSWQAGKQALAELHAAKTKEAFNAALRKLDAAFEDGPAQAAAREETARVIERRGKLVRTFQQLQIDREDLIPAKRVGLVMAMMAALVREFIEDDTRRREFSHRFVGLVGPRLRAGGEPATGAAGPAREP